MTRYTPTLRTSLEPGQALRLHLDRHTTLVVAKGAVDVVAPPLWLGERMLAGQIRLHEGQALRPPRDGWTEIVAEGEIPVELVRYRETGATFTTNWLRWPHWHGLAAALFQRMRALRGVS